MAGEKTIWMMVLESNGISDLKNVNISMRATENLLGYAEDRKHLLQKQSLSVCQQLGIVFSTKKVYKLRNNKGSLIVLHGNMTPNTVTSPFILEVCETRTSVMPGNKPVVIPRYNNLTCQRKFDSMLKRVERLENMMPDLPVLRNEKLTNEMKDVEQRLSFLNERMKEAESQEWKGMFKKHPLW